MKVNRTQLLQKVATVIAKKGKLEIRFLNGTFFAFSFEGASFWIFNNSSLDIYLFSLGIELKSLNQKNDQTIPNNPNK